MAKSMQVLKKSRKFQSEAKMEPKWHQSRHKTDLMSEKRVFAAIQSNKWFSNENWGSASFLAPFGFLLPLFGLILASLWNFLDFFSTCMDFAILGDTSHRIL
jgi:hypothetical protein